MKHRLLLFFFIFISTQFRTFAEPLRIGISVPLTGDMMQAGIAVQNGLQLFKQNNRIDGNNIQFIFEDNGYNIQKSIGSFLKLRDVKKVDMIYVLGDLPCEVIAPLSEQSNLPMIAVSFNPKIGENRRFILAFASSFSDMAVLLNGFLEKNNFKHLGIIMVSDPYYENLFQAMKMNLCKDQSLEIVENVSYSENDFLSTIEKIKKYNFDAIGVFLWPGQVSTFYRQASSRKLNIPTFGADVFESRDEIQKAQGAMNGAYYVQNLVNELFQRQYLNTFGNDEQVAYAGNAYEFANLIDSHLTKILQKKLFGLSLLEELTTQNSYAGKALGNYQIIRSSNGIHSHFNIVIKKIDKDSFKVL